MNPIKILTKIGSDVFYIGIAVGVGVSLGWPKFLNLFIADLIVLAAIFLIRHYHFKERPTPQPYKNWWQRLDASSFPSAHAARVSLLAVFFTVLFPQWILGWALLVCAISYSRVYLMKHDWYDIGAGILLGLVVGLVFFW